MLSDVEIFGSATATIVVSSSSMKLPTHTTISVHHFRELGVVALSMLGCAITCRTEVGWICRILVTLRPGVPSSSVAFPTSSRSPARSGREPTIRSPFT